MHNDLFEQDPGTRIQKRILERRDQTAADRMTVAQMRDSTEPDRTGIVDRFALSLTTPTEAEHLSARARLEHLYASLSVNIEAYDPTRSLAVEQIDSFLTAVVERIGETSGPDLASSALNDLIEARQAGLNPAKHSSLAVPEQVRPSQPSVLDIRTAAAFI